MKRRAVLATLGLLWAAGASASVADPPLSLSLSWLDAWGLCPQAAIGARDETARILGELGVEARWVEAEELLRLETAGIGVALMAIEPESWGLRPSTLGAVKGKGDARRDVVFVFTSNVIRAAGYVPAAGGCASARTQVQIGRAVSRVIVHEIVHAIAPDHPHSDAGLLNPSLSQDTLLASSVTVDPLCARTFVSRLRPSS